MNYLRDRAILNDWLDALQKDGKLVETPQPQGITAGDLDWLLEELSECPVDCIVRRWMLQLTNADKAAFAVTDAEIQTLFQKLGYLQHSALA